MTQADYDSPGNKPGGYFKGKLVPPYNDYRRDYYLPFLKYLHYMCVLDAACDYPESEESTDVQVETSIKQLEGELEREIKKKTPKRPIKKILIGEAPPAHVPGSVPVSYFYNPYDLWPSRSPWINGPKNAMFGKTVFASKIDFLKACARAGFLLLDLFPYAIKFKSKNQKYRDACHFAFDINNPNKYPFTILEILNSYLSFLSLDISIAFGLQSFGDLILHDQNCTNSFNNWANANHINLNPTGQIESPRTRFPYSGLSTFLRVAHRCGAFGPNTQLLKTAGY